MVRICSVDPDNPLNAASVRTPDGKCVTVDPERVREVFYADCPAEDLALAKTRLGPEPMAVMFQTVHVTPERFGRVPRTCPVTVTIRPRPVPRRSTATRNGSVPFWTPAKMT